MTVTRYVLSGGKLYNFLAPLGTTIGRTTEKVAANVVHKPVRASEKRA